MSTEEELDPVIQAYLKDVDRTLLIENLRLTPLERLQKLQAHYDFYEALRAAARSATTGG